MKFIVLEGTHVNVNHICTLEQKGSTYEPSLHIQISNGRVFTVRKKIDEFMELINPQVKEFKKPEPFNCNNCGSEWCRYCSQ